MNETSVNIVDITASTARDAANVRLLWTACMFSEKPAASSFPAYLLDLIIAFNTLPESKKFAFFMDILNNSPGSEELIEKTEHVYASILKLRKIKGKSQPLLVALMRAEKEFNKNFELAKCKYIELADKLNITALLPITTRDIVKREKPLLVWWLPDGNTAPHIQNIVKFFVSSIPDPEFLNLFDGSVKDHAAFMELDKITPAATGHTVLCDLLFSFPDPVTLTSQQVQVLRHDLSSVSRRLMEELVNTSKEAMNLSFEADNFSTLAALYKQKAAPLKAGVQKALDENPHLVTLKNETANARTCRLWMGMASFHTVYGFYGKLNILDQSAEAYSKEETAGKVNLSNTRVFLFLEMIENV